MIFVVVPGLDSQTPRKNSQQVWYRAPLPLLDSFLPTTQFELMIVHNLLLLTPMWIVKAVRSLFQGPLIVGHTNEVPC